MRRIAIPLAMVLALLLGGAIVWKMVADRQERARQIEQIRQQASWAPETNGAAEAKPATDPQLAAQQEIACIDRVLGGAIPPDANVQVELNECTKPAQPAGQERPQASSGDRGAAP